MVHHHVAGVQLGGALRAAPVPQTWHGVVYGHHMLNLILSCSEIRLHKTFVTEVPQIVKIYYN